MKIVQTFWSKPHAKCSADADGRSLGGWHSAQYHHMSWALSCLQLKTYYEKVELVTDDAGKALLIDQLKLPYSSWSTALNDLDTCDPELWALGKISSHVNQDEPFLHVDGDFFIWKKFRGELLDAEVIVQHLENGYSFYRTMVTNVIDNFTFLPPWISDRSAETTINAYNTGIVGGNNVGFLNEYGREALRFINQNITNIDLVNKGLFNTVFEQVLLYYLSRTRKAVVKRYTNMLDEERIIQSFQGLKEFKSAPKTKRAVHLYGYCKKRVEVCEELSKQLRMYHPTYHKAIVENFES